MSTSISTGDNNNNNNNNNNIISTKKERKKERKILNPKGPYGGEGLPTKNLCAPIPQTPEWQEILKDYRQLAATDDTSIAWVVREALIEYHDNHWPGNPGLPLTHWITGEPLSPAASEKLQAQSKPKPKPLPDFLTMTDQELLNFYNSPRTLYEDKVIAAYHIKKRGISVEEMRKMRESRMSQ